MRKLVLASQKGGVGKTTLALHLAVAAHEAGAGPVVMVDVDPQGSLALTWNLRKAEHPAMARTTIAELEHTLRDLEADGFRLVVIDTPPAITATISSDRFGFGGGDAGYVGTVGQSAVLFRDQRRQAGHAPNPTDLVGAGAAWPSGRHDF